ncbi:MAG: EF-P lysine aminoacylase GenX [Proteobacteria bacterium]|nr:EF-P lysine aminoacylase GenX [Pseudomonadota bacterium]
MTNDQRQEAVSATWQAVASKEVMVQRALMLKNIRAFFDARDVLEVDTPLLSHCSITDPHLDSLPVRFREQHCYLNTSPEYAMKRLLAGWHHPVYQVCKAFRDDELGLLHNPEFTMLEWYRPGFDMRQLMQEMEALIRVLLSALTGAAPGESATKTSSVKEQTEARFEYLSYRQAFIEQTNIDPHQATSQQCLRFAQQNNVEIPQGLTADDAVDDWLDWLLMQVVQAAFCKDGFTFIYDYPASQCALASIEDDGTGVAVAKRFELFYGELELANGFFELTDAAEQLRRFQQDNVQRQQTGKIVGDIDQRFIAALCHGLPACSGVAVGLDRLLMVLTGKVRIEQVLSFPWHRA